MHKRRTNDVLCSKSQRTEKKDFAVERRVNQGFGNHVEKSRLGVKHKWANNNDVTTHNVKIGSRIKTGGSNQWPSWLAPTNPRPVFRSRDLYLPIREWQAETLANQTPGPTSLLSFLQPSLLCGTETDSGNIGWKKIWAIFHCMQRLKRVVPVWPGHDDLVLDCDLSRHQWSPDIPDRSDDDQDHDLWWSDTRSYSWFLIWLALHCLAAQKNALIMEDIDWI